MVCATILDLRETACLALGICLQPKAGRQRDRRSGLAAVTPCKEHLLWVLRCPDTMHRIGTN